MLFRRGCRVLGFIIAGALLLCAIAAAISAWSNHRLRNTPTVTEDLGSLDKARLAEALHLRRELGDAVWLGLGEAEIPVLLWNRDYSFLVGHPDPPSGWTLRVDDSIAGEPYYRQPTNEPQNFAVQVGDRWVASMATKLETDAFLMEMIRGALPSPIRPLFPYRVLVQPSEVQISAVLHESFHVYQVQVAQERLREAEKAHGEGDRYWSADAAMHDDWRREIALLAKAVKAPSEHEAASLARQFLEQRTARRSAHDLAPALSAYERQIEWEEGLAKYVELAIWRAAYADDGYEPLSDMAADPDFRGYATFPGRWSQEIAQMGRQAAIEGEARFYYTGMAQAMLLDRLVPGWKDRVLTKDVWLETLLAEATE